MRARPSPPRLRITVLAIKATRDQVQRLRVPHEAHVDAGGSSAMPARLHERVEHPPASRTAPGHSSSAPCRPPSSPCCCAAYLDRGRLCPHRAPPRWIARPLGFAVELLPDPSSSSPVGILTSAFWPSTSTDRRDHMPDVRCCATSASGGLRRRPPHGRHRARLMIVRSSRHTPTSSCSAALPRRAHRTRHDRLGGRTTRHAAWVRSASSAPPSWASRPRETIAVAMISGSIITIASTSTAHDHIAATIVSQLDGRRPTARASPSPRSPKWRWCSRHLGRGQHHRPDHHHHTSRLGPTRP